MGLFNVWEVGAAANRRVAAQANMRPMPVVIDENERWRMRGDARLVPLAGSRLVP
jgi:hypothetical protein